MNDNTNRKQALEDQITELEGVLAHLKAELHREQESEQHAAIDRLEEYLADLDNRYANLKDFWGMLREEIREIFSSDNRKES